ncbi:AGAP002723-PA-like protein [Anopheles sinensis]|uniref:AGAP002723-PA-like protein n=1 Tax=Anopheles sinensis TaxID=74873 RepID=A0A084VRJ2_ANOSI|nr:AGAP002723-PA-like protein [Anopheles sinensis]
MAEGTYEYECMRAELLELAKPTREEFEEKMRLRQETQVEEQLTEEMKEVDLQEESIQSTSGKMDELNSILSATQQKINKFKVACGSLTSLLKLRPSTPSSEPAAASGSEEPTDSGRSINDALDALDTMKDQEVASDAHVAKSAALDLGQKMSAQLGKLDSLLYKADNATYSMKHQTDQMKKIAK